MKAPKASSLSRKRAQVRNPPSGKRRCRGTSANEPEGIDPAQQVKEYRNEPFSVANKKLFCRAFKEELSVKKSVAENHVKSSKHAKASKGKEKMSKKETRERDLAERSRSTMMMFTFVEKHYHKHSKFFV